MRFFHAQRNKPRLYVCIFTASPDPSSLTTSSNYKWAYWVGPKRATYKSRGILYRCVPPILPDNSRSLERRRRFSPGDAPAWLYRVKIAKVEDLVLLDSIITDVPLEDEDWMKRCFLALKASGKALGTSVREWRPIRGDAVSYCVDYYASHSGRPRRGMPCLDMLKGAEIVE